MTLPDKAGSITIGRFWTPPYRAAWRRLQEMLAARYDDDPLVREVAVTSCASMTGEPFILPMMREDLAALHAAGFTDAAYEACLLGAIDDYAAWKRTVVDFTVNPFRASDQRPPRPDDAFTNRVLAAFRQKFGARGVLANHGLQAPLEPRQVAVYEQLKTLGPPIEFQAVRPVMNWDATIDLARAYGASEIELWNSRDAGGPANISLDQLKRWAAALRADVPHAGQP